MLRGKIWTANPLLAHNLGGAMKNYAVPIILIVIAIIGLLYANRTSERIAQWVSQVLSFIFTASP
ncbi:Uncharacterised protein [Yersinia kristensenii]|nr:Uncharacterised protein [Yersinia kristensenii]